VTAPGERGGDACGEHDRPRQAVFGASRVPRHANLTSAALGGDNRCVKDGLTPLPLPEPALSEGGLVLRAWDEQDVLIVLAAGLDELISRYRYSLPGTADAARTWIAATRAQRLAGERLELAITERGTPVGSVALVEIADGNAMVRYWLLPEARGRGLATGAVRLLADWAFSTLGLGRLAAFVEFENRASGAVLERCGFVEEGRLRRHMTSHAGERVDTLLFGLLPEDCGA
jgi:[ribosomal protein S5]-alanine N-acetyltransferase